jgi:twitching motility protein PilT
MDLKEVLKYMIDNDASDIFIIAGLQLSYKKGGQQYRTDSERLMPADTYNLVQQIYVLANREFTHFTENDQHDDDFSFSIPGLGRFRANVFRQRGSAGAVIRVIPFGLPNPDDFNIPEEVLVLSRFQKGLVLVTGSAGAGKSTTLACIVDRLNHERTGHIVTMEDPIEYVHRHGTCIVTQREIPTDILTYSEALRSAIRESPDVILLGEMRDQDTMATAVTAAEMSQLIFSTMHTSSASTTVDRIVDSFPSAQQRQIRMQLSMTLKAVVSQQLLPKRSGEGRVLACEVMVVNPAIRNLIREAKTPQIENTISTTSSIGNTTMDNDLVRLVRAQQISAAAAIEAAHDRDYVSRQVR